MIYIIIGPTGSGKTIFAEKLAVFMNASIISCDSLAIYRYADIGTAKPYNPDIKYYLIDIKNPEEDYTANDFNKDCKSAIESINSENKNIIICGGTISYLDSFINGLPKIKIISPETKNKVKNYYDNLGLEYLTKLLEEKDELMFKEIDKKNPRRVMRALEVILETGEKFSELRKLRRGFEGKYKILCVLPEKELLLSRIRQRVEKMFRDGLIDEVKNLYDKYGEKIKIFSGIGYKETLELIKGKIDLDSCKELIIKNSMKYAKRQKTFISKLKNVYYLKINSYEGFPERYIKTIIDGNIKNQFNN